MRSNNQILNRNLYQDSSSYIIRQPLNESSYVQRSNHKMEYQDKSKDVYQNVKNYRQSSVSGFHDKYPNRNRVSSQNRQNNRQISYNSRGSYAAKNSIKMTDYVASQAKDLIRNRDKFKYDSQSQIRCGSLQHYPMAFKGSIQVNDQNLEKGIQRKQNNNQPSQIPSFGIQYRSTTSGEYKYKNSPPLNRYTLNSIKIQDPSKCHINHVKTQIDERIQKLRFSSTSSKQKQRLTHLKVIDNNRLQNMDKINDKIKNILTTLEEEESHYKQRINGSSVIKRVNIDGQACFQNQRNRQRYDIQQANSSKNNTRGVCDLGNGVSKYDRSFTNYKNKSIFYEDSSFLNMNSSSKYCQDNTSSHYQYEDKPATLKNSQSFFKESPERSFQRCSVQKQKSRENYKRISIERQIPTRTYMHIQSRNHDPNQKVRVGYGNKGEINLSESISKSQTQLIASRAIGLTSNPLQSSTINQRGQPSNSYSKQSNKPLDNSSIYHQSFNDNRRQSLTREKERIFSQIKLRSQQKARYSDEIKQTSTISESKYGLREKELQTRPNMPSEPQQGQNDKLQCQLRQYQIRLALYQKQMSSSKVLDSFRYHQRFQKLDFSHKNRLDSKALFSQPKSVQLSKSKSKNQYLSYKHRGLDSIEQTKNKKDKLIHVSGFHDQIVQSEINMEKRFDQLKNQRLAREQKQKQNKQKIQLQLNNTRNTISNSKFRDVKNKQINSRNHTNLANEQKQYDQPNPIQKSHNLGFQPSSRQVLTPKNPSPLKSNQFTRDENRDLIQSLKKERQQAVMMSKIKSRINISASVDFVRLQGSHQRSQSNNSRISSITMIKGKDIDAEIIKIQQKMQSYKKMKKQLHIQSQQNTQRSVTKEPITNLMCESVISQQRPFATNFTQIDKRGQFPKLILKNTQPLSISKVNLPTTATQLLKSLTQKNTYVKVTSSSFMEQQKTCQIKSEIQEGIHQEKHTRSRSTVERQQSLKMIKSKHTSSKQNILPPTITTIQSPQYKNGGKRVVLGLAENFIFNCLQPSSLTSRVTLKNDVNTPKPLKNLKDKLNDKSIVLRKAQKRGFRSQFINNLHEDNQILTSSTKKYQDDDEGDEITTLTVRISPQNKQTLNKILNLLQQQISIDQQFRNEKKWFNSLVKKEKWSVLLKQYVKIVPQNNEVLQSQIEQIFTLTQQQSNPFYSTRGVNSTIQSLISRHVQCQQKWQKLTEQISDISAQNIISCGLSQNNLDIQRKGYIQIQDLTRFINMQLNTYHRQRDIWLIWERLVGTKSQNSGKTTQTNQINRRLNYQQFIKGLGVMR